MKQCRPHIWLHSIPLHSVFGLVIELLIHGGVYLPSVDQQRLGQCNRTMLTQCSKLEENTPGNPDGHTSVITLYCYTLSREQLQVFLFTTAYTITIQAKAGLHRPLPCFADARSQIALFLFDTGKTISPALELPI